MDEFIPFLRDVGEEGRADCIADCRSAIEVGSPRGLEKLRAAFGAPERLDESRVSGPDEAKLDYLIDRTFGLEFPDSDGGIDGGKAFRA